MACPAFRGGSASTAPAEIGARLARMAGARSRGCSSRAAVGGLAVGHITAGLPWHPTGREHAGRRRRPTMLATSQTNGHARMAAEYAKPCQIVDKQASWRISEIECDVRYTGTMRPPEINGWSLSSADAASRWGIQVLHPQRRLYAT